MNYTLDAVDSYKSVLKDNNSADNQAVKYLKFCVYSIAYVRACRDGYYSTSACTLNAF